MFNIILFSSFIWTFDFHLDLPFQLVTHLDISIMS